MCGSDIVFGSDAVCGSNAMCGGDVVCGSNAMCGGDVVCGGDVYIMNHAIVNKNKRGTTVVGRATA